MIEALKIKEIDALIEEMESGVKTAPSLQKPVSITPSSQPQEVTSTQQKQEEVPPQKEEIVEDEGAKLYTELVAKIKDRSYELGVCFEEKIRYKSFTDGVLTWESCADDTCKQKLKHGYSVIKMLVKELFGFETKIKGEACSKPQEEVSKKEETPPEKPAVEQTPPQAEQNSMQDPNPSSCVASCAGLDEPKNEVDDILSQPVVQKAIELFEAKKVVVQSKV
jgi:DNA polymerase-3 subunit gamma/tau